MKYILCMLRNSDADDVNSKHVYEKDGNLFTKNIL